MGGVTVDPNLARELLPQKAGAYDEYRAIHHEKVKKIQFI